MNIRKVYPYVIYVCSFILFVLGMVQEAIYILLVGIFTAVISRRD